MTYNPYHWSSADPDERARYRDWEAQKSATQAAIRSEDHSLLGLGFLGLLFSLFLGRNSQPIPQVPEPRGGYKNYRYHSSWDALALINFVAEAERRGWTTDQINAVTCSPWNPTYVWSEE
jgi:hypothetical protein